MGSKTTKLILLDSLLQEKTRMERIKFLLGPLVLLFAYAFVGSTSLHITDFLAQDCGESNHACEPDTCCYGTENTCCPMPNAPNGIGCCPIKDAQCCGDGIHCCWPGFTCTADGQCYVVKPYPVNVTGAIDGELIQFPELLF